MDEKCHTSTRQMMNAGLSLGTVLKAGSTTLGCLVVMLLHFFPIGNIKALILIVKKIEKRWMNDYRAEQTVEHMTCQTDELIRTDIHILVRHSFSMSQYLKIAL